MFSGMPVEHAALAVQVFTGIFTGLVTGIACFLALRIELRYMRRDLDNAWERLNNHGALISALQVQQATTPLANATTHTQEPR